jgi:hypothetical protein
MQHPCVYHVIVMFIQLMHCRGVTQGPFFVIVVVRSLQLPAVLKRIYHFAKIVIGMGMMLHQGLLGIKGRP